MGDLNVFDVFLFSSREVSSIGIGPQLTAAHRAAR